MLNIGGLYIYNKKLIYIVSGQYDTPRGISNYWFWNEVNSDGTLGKPGEGYGGSSFIPYNKQYKVKEVITIKFIDKFSKKDLEVEPPQPKEIKRKYSR